MQEPGYNANFHKLEKIARVFKTKALDLVEEIPDPEPPPDEPPAKKKTSKRDKKKASKKKQRKSAKKAADQEQNA